MSFINILHLRKLAQRSSMIHIFAKYLWIIHYLQELRGVPGLHWMKKTSLESNGIFNIFFTSEKDQNVGNITGESHWVFCALVTGPAGQAQPFLQGHAPYPGHDAVPGCCSCQQTSSRKQKVTKAWATCTQFSLPDSPSRQVTQRGRREEHEDNATEAPPGENLNPEGWILPPDMIYCERH